MDNALPVNPHKLESLIGATEPVELEVLRPFIRYGSLDQPCEEDRAARIHILDSVRAAVLVRDGGRCRRCHSARNLEIDHIVPICKGGDSEEPNLQTLCRRCNRRKWKKLVPNI
ncbi:HNH endonuclease [Candidatus Binatus sp.]|uniref:HNH endonuclease n=1 Tax=Candidatus Binatus sp. TaxID=2811406 RepID=UPI002F928F18